MSPVHIRVAPLLYSYTGGLRIVDVEATTLGEALLALDRLYPGVAFRIVDEQEKIRPHMNVFVGEENVRDLDTPLSAGAEIYIVGALSGG
ncbi:MAG TPA: MoaD/ThiS family protein [Terriglobia bacterium]|nr:MoaD/ThiS family protein [Terriglobia bacterium]